MSTHRTIPLDQELQDIEKVTRDIMCLEILLRANILNRTYNDSISHTCLPMALQLMAKALELANLLEHRQTRALLTQQSPQP